MRDLIIIDYQIYQFFIIIRNTHLHEIPNFIDLFIDYIIKIYSRFIF